MILTAEHIKEIMHVLDKPLTELEVEFIPSYGLKCYFKKKCKNEYELFHSDGKDIAILCKKDVVDVLHRYNENHIKHTKLQYENKYTIITELRRELK